MPGVLLGHEGGMYRIWNMTKREVNVSKQVLIDETKYPAMTEGMKTKERSQVRCDNFKEDLNSSEPLLSIGNHAKSISIGEKVAADSRTVEDQDNQVNCNTTDVGDEEGHRYPQRLRKEPKRLVSNAVRRGNEEDMPTLRMAMESDEATFWKTAVKEELRSLENGKTWDIVDRPRNGTVIHCIWVLRKERNADGDLSRYKARLVICGNQDNAALTQTFVPVVDFTVVRLILAVAAQKGWLIHQVDYSIAFL